MDQKEEYSPYCPICDACGEDGCCPATACKQNQNGKYCATYLKELKFGYLMYHKILNLIDGDSKYEEKVNEIFDDLWDKIFDDENKNK